jgi:hypothetical protein
MERQKIHGVTLFSFVVSAFVYHYAPTISFIFMCLGLLFLYEEWIKNSIQRVNTIARQVLWLMLYPIFFVGVAIIIMGVMFAEVLANKMILSLFSVFFFVLSWGLATYQFELRKLKVTIQIINATFISGLSLSFLSYYKLDVMKEVLTPEIIAELIPYNVGLGAFIDVMIKTITLPFVLAGIWANVMVVYRDYRERK